MYVSKRNYMEEIAEKCGSYRIVQQQHISISTSKNIFPGGEWLIVNWQTRALFLQ